MEIKERMPEYRLNLVRELRRRQTESEELLWQHLRGGKLDGRKFRRQRPLGRYVADLCCDADKLVVEIDGAVHEEDEQKAYDAVRDAELAAHGYTLVRVTVDNVLERLSQTLTKISQAAAQGLIPNPLPREGEGGEASAKPGEGAKRPGEGPS